MYNVTIEIHNVLRYAQVFDELSKRGLNPYSRGDRISCVSLSYEEAWDIARKGTRYWFW